ncbi:MAG: hypothetical protein BWY44_01467 [Candidatus Omnitrophica bacterium ADurb.Bin292]|nr:MAG: hypothetical protein BWY44_01467 [Candidatus Omnitrophica bacterium ADurb.Bin292]HQB12367.1 hypothetical protein [Candidatus Omnitrophota bacterium]
MNKQEILNIVREQLGNSRIQFPSKIDFCERDGEIILFLDGGAVKNMQDDAAAFEGWILGVKAAVDRVKKDYSYTLEWPRMPSQSGHYQRFLYRVQKFNEVFGGSAGWFKIKEPLMLSDLKISENENEIYLLNAPKTLGERLNSSDDSVENFLENQIVKKQDDENGLGTMFQVTLARQLPVGLFRRAVKKDNAIFTGGKSAVDLWGVRHVAEGRPGELYIFELKAKENRKAGVLSELFFYAMLLRDEQDRRFVRKANADAEISLEGKMIRGTKRLNAIILAPEIHPIITESVFCLLNEALARQNIKFGFVQMEYVMETQFRFQEKW